MLRIFSSGKIRAIPMWLPGKQEPLPCPRPVLAQLPNSPGTISPSCPALQDPLGCAEDPQWGMEQLRCHSQTPEPVESRMELGFPPAPSHGSSRRRGWGVRQTFHLHFNFNKIALFCVLLRCWGNKSLL